MADDETLREALIELAALRSREAASLRVSNAIIDGLAAITAAEGPGALNDLLGSIRTSLACEHVAFVSSGPGGTARISHATWAPVSDAQFPAALLRARKTLRVVDTAKLPWWTETPEPLRAMRSALSTPIALPGIDDSAVLCCANTVEHFGPEDKPLLVRLAALAAQALRSLSISQRNRLLAGVIDGASASVVIADARSEGTPLIYVNAAFEELSGYAAADVLGRNCRFLSAEPSDSPERSRLREAVRARKVGTFSLRNRRRDGSIFWNRLSLYPIGGPDGSTDYLVATQVDITAERLADEARAEAEFRMSAALSATSEGFLLLNPAGRIVFANARFREFFEAKDADWGAGVSFEAAWSAHLRAQGTDPEAAKQAARARRDAIMHGGENREERLPDGRILLLNDRALSDGGAVSIATDITSLKATEQMLAQRAAAIDATEDGIAVTDEVGRFVYMNVAHLRMFGYRDQIEVLGRPWSILYAPAQAAFIERVGMPALAETGTWRSELVGRTRDGAEVDQEVSLTKLPGIGIVCVTRNIAERRKGERERAALRERLHAAQRQEAIGQLASGVAHDFNNLMSVVSASAALIEGDLPDAHPARTHVERVLAAVGQASTLVRQLLESGKGAGEHRPFDLVRAAREAHDLLRAGVPPRIEVAATFPTEPLPVVADPADLLQVVLNLGINARDAMDQGGGMIDIRLERAGQIEGQDALIFGALEPGREHAALTVRDTGPGMTVAVREKILAPYYTTKGDAGTGLGLAIVSGVVRKIGGALALWSEVGEGSRFTVYWPLVADTPEPQKGKPGLPHQAAASLEAIRGATIIVCDDYVEVANTISGLLEAHGAEVAVCTDPRDARDAVEEDPDAWSLLITDFDMPHLDGEGLARAARAAAPALPILLCTALHLNREPGGLFDASIAKPVEPEPFLAAVALLLRSE
ncbi:MAG: PAS domain S-box protein [Pseudomonadota bacterium]